MGTPLREGPVRPLPAMAAGGCDGASYWSRAPGKCRQTGGEEVRVAAFAPSGFPWAALYSLSEPTAWPPALRAEREIPPPAFGRPPPFLKGGPWGDRPASYPGAQEAAWNRCETSGGPGCRAPHGNCVLGRTRSTRGPVEARTPPRTAGGTGRHPPLDGCRPARGPGGLPGRSLSLSLGRESEARTSGATGVLLE